MRPAALVTLLAMPLVAAACGGASAPTADVVPGTVALHTLPGVAVPVAKVTHAARGTAPGWVFVAEKQDGKPGGPLILDNAGRVRWFHPIATPVQATDFRVQRYRGTPVLTWWQGTISKAGIGQGYDEIYDTSYREVAQVHAGNGQVADLHEFQLTPRGTAYVTAYKELPMDLTAVGGPKRGWVMDSVVQEIDVASGKVVFEWHSLDHVPLSESTQAHREPARHASKKRAFDYFHVNSISDGPNGTILISARNTSTVYLLRRDGSIVWRLGGKGNQFRPAIHFNFQHNARLHPGNVLTVFDNGAIPKMEPYTRPLVLKLDVAHKRVKILKRFVHPRKILSPYEGDIELLRDGGTFVGWGGVRKVSEFTPGGKLRFELELPYGDTYRGFRQVWAGTPSSPPVAAVAGGTVFASWNGSTKVAYWRLLAGSDKDHLERVAGSAWRGLETSLRLGVQAKVVEVQALDAGRRTLATSAPVST